MLSYISPFFFVLYCFFDSLFIVLVKKFSIQIGISSLEVGCYANIFAFFVLIPYLIQHFESFVKNFTNNISLSLLVFAPVLKLLVVKKMPVVLLSLTSFVTPIAIMLLSFIFLKEFNKKHIDKYIKSVLSFLAVILFSMSYEGHMDIPKFAYVIVTLYIILKAVYHIVIKKKASDTLFTLVYIKFFYVILSIVVFSVSKDLDFHLKSVFSPKVALIGMITIFSYLFLILSFKFNNVSSLQHLKYTQILFSIVCGYLFLNESINKEQVICTIFILLISMLRIDGFYKTTEWIKKRKEKTAD